MRRSFCTLKGPLSLNQPISRGLDSCKSMKQIKQVHAQMIINGDALNPISANKFIALLISPSFGSVAYAHDVFNQILKPDLFIYNNMIKAHSISSSSPSYSLVIFRSVVHNLSFSPNQYTFVFTLKACGNGLGVLEGDQVRVHAIKTGLESNLFVANAVIGMYANLGLVDKARNFLNWSPKRDLYSWNTLLGGYVTSGKMEDALEMFDKMPERDVVSWTTLIAGHVQVGCFMDALDCFHKMLKEDAIPNAYTMVSILGACANLVAVDQGRWVHVYIYKNKIQMNERLLASLIDMYSKCGELESAIEVFNTEPKLKRKVWPWNAMIGGFALHGRSKEAIDLFERMKVEKISPNKITFISLLSACSHGNEVEGGMSYFESMVKSYGIEPEIEHYGCVVDLLGRGGYLSKAEEIISSMPMAPDAMVWGALLNACKIHKDVERGEKIGKFIRELGKDHLGCHVLLANMYSLTGKWNEAKTMRETIASTGEKKIPGCSSIELNGAFHQFLVGDRSHPQTKQLYAFLDEMSFKLKKFGFAPEFGEVLLDIDDEEDKETALSMHSEKLAIAFGLMNTPPGTPIRIVKNLRVCRDCHQATKFISKVYDRQIIVRDRNRFHHFKDGSCSCNDYWSEGIARSSKVNENCKTRPRSPSFKAALRCNYHCERCLQRKNTSFYDDFKRSFLLQVSYDRSNSRVEIFHWQSFADLNGAPQSS